MAGGGEDGVASYGGLLGCTASLYGLGTCTASLYGLVACTAPLYGLGAVPVVMVADGTEVSGGGLEAEAGKLREG